MAFVMEQDIPFCPVDIGFLSAVGIMLQSDRIAKLVEKFLGFGEDGSVIKTT